MCCTICRDRRWAHCDDLRVRDSWRTLPDKWALQHLINGGTKYMMTEDYHWRWKRIHNSAETKKICCCPSLYKRLVMQYRTSVWGSQTNKKLDYVGATITLILDMQNFGSVFLRSNFWYRCNLRCYWQSQMLHCKIRITLASEVFTKKYYALPKHLRFLRALWYSYWMSHMYFDISKHRKRKW